MSYDEEETTRSCHPCRQTEKETSTPHVRTSLVPPLCPTLFVSHYAPSLNSYIRGTTDNDLESLLLLPPAPTDFNGNDNRMLASKDDDKETIVHDDEDDDNEDDESNSRCAGAFHHSIEF